MSLQDQRSPYPFHNIGGLVAVLKDRACAAIEASYKAEKSHSHKEQTPAELRMHQKERLEARRNKKNRGKYER